MGASEEKNNFKEITKSLIHDIAIFIGIIDFHDTSNQVAFKISECLSFCLKEQ